jgi:cell division protein FtsI (penicillin-binding protein 3)
MTTADPPFEDIAEPSEWSIRRLMQRLPRWLEPARSEEAAEEEARLRIFFVMALFCAGFLTLALFATKASLLSGLGRGEHAGALTPNARADLVDRNGEVLAMDLVHYGLYITPKDVSDPAATQRALLTALPLLSPKRLAAAFDDRHKEYYLIGGLTPEVKNAIHDMALPGIAFQEESARAYPLGQTGAHVIGLASKDGTGMSGLERAFDKDIRAEAGRAPAETSIDLRVQGALQDELQAAGDFFAVKDAVGIVVNVRTGEILGMASYPAFDPNAPERTDPGNMVNHAAATVYEPGSVFKVFTLAMGLDTGKVNIRTMFDVCSPLVLPGQIIHDYDKGDCRLPLWEVFTHSSNIGAAKMAVSVGGESMQKYFRGFGLYAKAPSELIESARPLLPKRMSENIVATNAFGQAISVSPLALATGMSSIVNGGIYRPLTLRKLPSGQAPAAGYRVISEQTSRVMLGLMRLNATNGTGRPADLLAPCYMVGGKTGTATKLVNGRYDLGKRNLASFAGVFPTNGGFDQDRYYVLVMMDEPRVTGETGGFTTGGAVSAPIVGKIIRRIAPFLGAPRSCSPTDEPAAGRNKDDVDDAILRSIQP